MGNLERLQRSVVELLRSVSDLRLADIKAEDSDDNAGKAEGLRVTVLSPLPRAASRYAAGPVFSEVEISVEISRDKSIAARAPSIISAAENVSRALHNWSPPVACGYGRVYLSQENPWLADGPSKIRIILNAQSVLQ